MVEEGLGELVFRGLVSADSFTGLRALITPLSKSTQRELEKRRRKRKPVYTMDEAGRWVRLKREERGLAPFLTERNDRARIQPIDREAIEAIAKKLLQRYGVVFRKLLDREAVSIPWRDLLKVYRRLEARGEIRGGRFVGGFSGEQFALTEAVQLLRSIRRTPAEGMMISLSAADPLNLQGIITPGPRLSQSSSNRVLYRDGVPVAVMEGKELRYLVEMSAADQWQAKNALLRRHVPPKVRTYLNDSGRTVSPQTVSSLTH
jgi:ATP-dependent Lhr-like helicase